MPYVQNVQPQPAQTPAQNAYAEAQRLTRLIDSVKSYIDICECPTVNRMDEAADLRGLAHDLHDQREQVVNQLTGNATANASQAGEAPMVLGRMQFGEAAKSPGSTSPHQPAANCNAAGDQAPLVMGQFRF